MAGQAEKKKNQEMAQRMKAQGIMRRSGSCPIGASHSFTIGKLEDHLRTCPGPRRRNAK